MIILSRVIPRGATSPKAARLAHTAIAPGEHAARSQHDFQRGLLTAERIDDDRSHRRNGCRQIDIVDALQLLSGGCVERKSRNGTERAEVAATFDMLTGPCRAQTLA